MSRLTICRIGFVLLLPLLASCEGNQRASITGKVTLDGEPLEKGVITFQPVGDTKSPSSGGDISQGQYTVLQTKGPMAGVFRVEINALRKSGRKIPAGSPAPPGTMVDEYVNAIPAKYAGELSILSVEVKPGTNVYDFVDVTQITAVDDGVMTITLNRPEKLNAFTGRMMFELIEAFDEADSRDEVRAVVVTGAGRAFCAGADLSAGAKTFDYEKRFPSGQLAREKEILKRRIIP